MIGNLLVCGKKVGAKVPTLLLLVTALVFLTGFGFGLRAELTALFNETRAMQEADPELAPLRGKIYPGQAQHAPLRYYGIGSKPNAREKKALEKKFAIYRNYQDGARKIFKKYNSPTLPLANSLMAAFETAMIDLYNGHLTYGEYARKRKMIVEKGEQALSRQNARAESEFFNFLMTQHLINSMNQPARRPSFQCFRVGAYWDCN